MATATPHAPITSDFIPLTPELQASYDEIRRTISEFAGRPHGLALILNAIATTGDTSVSMMALWSGSVADVAGDARDLAGIVNDRPIDLTYFTD